MEKRGVIQEGVTPPEDQAGEKAAGTRDLADHANTRLSDKAEKALREQVKREEDARDS